MMKVCFEEAKTKDMTAAKTPTLPKNSQGGAPTSACTSGSAGTQNKPQRQTHQKQILQGQRGVRRRSVIMGCLGARFVHVPTRSNHEGT